MKCETCHGNHYIIQNHQQVPCPSCGGNGQQSCCEGAVGNCSDTTNGIPEPTKVFPFMILRPLDVRVPTPKSYQVDGVYHSYRDICKHGIERATCDICDPVPDY